MTEQLPPVIEVPTIDDAAAVASLRMLYSGEFRNSSGRTFPIDPKSFLESQHHFLESRLRDPDAFLRVLRTSEGVAGFMSAIIFHPDKQDACLTFLIVEPGLRNQGWGSRLFDEFESNLPPERPISVVAAGADQEALGRFYGRLGFKFLDEYTMIKDRRAVA